MRASAIDSPPGRRTSLSMIVNGTLPADSLNSTWAPSTLEPSVRATVTRARNTCPAAASWAVPGSRDRTIGAAAGAAVAETAAAEAAGAPVDVGDEGVTSSRSGRGARCSGPPSTVARAVQANGSARTPNNPQAPPRGSSQLLRELLHPAPGVCQCRDLLGVRNLRRLHAEGCGVGALQAASAGGATP